MNILLKSFRKIWIVIPLSIVLSSCLEDGESIGSSAAEDDAIIDGYLTANNLTAERTASGLRYIVLSEGSGKSTEPSLINDVSYQFSFLETGQTIQNNSSYTFTPSVGSFLPGLTEGSLLMKEGDTFRFFVPSRLGFGGNSGRFNGVEIPSFSNFILDATLNEVRNEEEQKLHEIGLISSHVAELEDVISVDERPTGVVKATLTEGFGGDTPAYGQLITVSYNGSLLNGVEFDRGTQFSATLDTLSLIKGWYDAISQMEVGEEAWIVIPSDRAYGATGNLDIPPFSPIRFRVILEGFQ